MSNDRLEQIRAQLHAYKQAGVGFSELGSFLSSADFNWLVGEVERLRLIYYAPTGDNHHNAALCPYCTGGA